VSIRKHLWRAAPPLVFVAAVLAAHPATAQVVTFRPYIQPGDNGAFGTTDQMIVAWQTDEAHPVATAYSVRFRKTGSQLVSAPVSARVVDDYLSADPQFSGLVLPFRYEAHSNYTAVLRNLEYDATYTYQVSGPGMPAGGFTSTFHTRKRGGHFVFQVQGDEGYYPNIPGTNPPLVANYEARTRCRCRASRRSRRLISR